MNNDKRTIFIGDVHGCFDEFELLIEKLKIQDNDTVYLVGDMINKGPKSWKMIKFLYKNQDQYKAILGNHELNFIKWLSLGTKISKNEVFIKLSEKFNKHKNIYDYFMSIPLYIEEDNFLLIHGGLDPLKSVSEHTKEELTNIREINNQAWYNQYIGEKKVIYGHWAIDGLRIRGNTIGLDTGCLYGGALTAYVLETGDIYSQPALDIYQNIFEKIKKACTYTN